MAKVNVFVDGSWLFNACRYDRSLANATEHPERNFPLDFAKLNKELASHVSRQVGGAGAHEIGDAYISTSIFQLPDDFDSWPNSYPMDCTSADVERTRNAVRARERFIDKARAAGYGEDAIFSPRLKPYIVKQLSEFRYQEKQVDATVVALLVKYAITQPDDYHIIISGDADMLPAVKIAYPEYTENVSVATTHPDALTEEQRQSSFSLFNFDFRIEPFILEANAEGIIEGDHVYRCAECGKVFARPNAIPRRARPTCGPCFRRKQPFK